MFAKMRHSSSASKVALIPKATSPTPIGQIGQSRDKSTDSPSFLTNHTPKKKSVGGVKLKEGGGNVNPCYSDEASVISQIYLQCVRRGPSLQLTDREEDALRRSYIQIMRRRTWKCELIAVAETLINVSATAAMRACSGHVDGIVSSNGWSASATHHELSDTLVTVTYGDNDQTFSSSRSLAICIGRHSACDVVLRAKEPPWTCSRLHAVLYVVPARNELIVADVGSYHGIRTTWRSQSQRGRPSSYPGHRYLLAFSLDEEVGLRLGSQLIFIKISKIYHPTTMGPIASASITADSSCSSISDYRDHDHDLDLNLNLNLNLNHDHDHHHHHHARTKCPNFFANVPPSAAVIVQPYPPNNGGSAAMTTTTTYCGGDGEQNDKSLFDDNNKTKSFLTSLKQQQPAVAAAADMSPKCLLRKQDDDSLKLYSLAEMQENSNNKYCGNGNYNGNSNNVEINKWLLNSNNNNDNLNNKFPHINNWQQNDQSSLSSLSVHDATASSESELNNPPYNDSDSELLKCLTSMIIQDDEDSDENSVEKFDLFSSLPNSLNNCTTYPPIDNEPSDPRHDNVTCVDHDNYANEQQNCSENTSIDRPPSSIPNDCLDLEHLNMKHPFDSRCGFGCVRDSLKLCS